MESNQYNKGRYKETGAATKDEETCLKIKTALRERFLEKYFKGGELFEPYFGYGLLNKKIYSKYKFDKQHRCDKTIQTNDCYLGDCETFIQEYELNNVRVADFDHHGLPFLALSLFIKTHQPSNCIIFLTFGTMSFSRKARIFKRKVVYNATAEEKIKLCWDDKNTIVAAFLNDLCADNGYKIQEVKGYQFKTLVSYYGLYITKI